MRNNVYNLFQRHHAEKASGKKHVPLHLLKECLADAGINWSKYGWLVRKHGNAPQPALITPGKGNSCAATKHFRKAEVLAYIKDCLEKESRA